MRSVAVLLLCLACASEGRRVRNAEDVQDPSQALATLLKAVSPQVGWQTGSTAAMKGVRGEDAPFVSRRKIAQFATAAGMASVFGALPAVAADDDDDEVKVKAPPLRTDAVLQAPEKYQFKKKYKDDTELMIANMRIVKDMGRGTVGMEDIAKKTRKQMIEYMGLYRPRPETQKLVSFSIMYSCVNTIAGHYASYGYKYPIPEKRRVGLEEEFQQVERALKRGK